MLRAHHKPPFALEATSILPAATSHPWQIESRELKVRRQLLDLSIPRRGRHHPNDTSVDSTRLDDLPRRRWSSASRKSTFFLFGAITFIGCFCSSCPIAKRPTQQVTTQPMPPPPYPRRLQHQGRVPARCCRRPSPASPRGSWQLPVTLLPLAAPSSGYLVLDALFRHPPPAQWFTDHPSSRAHVSHSQSAIYCHPIANRPSCLVSQDLVAALLSQE